MLVEPAKPNDPKGMCRAINRLSGGKIEQKASELDSVVTSAVNSVIDSAITDLSDATSAVQSGVDSLETLASDTLESLHSYESALSDATSEAKASALADFKTNSNLISNISNALSALSVGEFDDVSDMASANSAACSSLQTDIATISNTLSAVSDLAEANSVACSSLQTDVLANSNAISTTSNLAQSNSAACSSLQTDIATISDQVSDLIADVATNVTEIDAVSDMQSSLITDIGLISNTLSAVSDLTEANSQACSSLQTDVLANSNAISTTSNLAQANSAACSSLQTDILTISNQVSDLIADVATNVTEIDAVSDVVSGNVSDILAIEAFANTASSLITDVSEAQSNISNQVSDLIADVATISDTLSAVSDLAEANSVACSSLQTDIATISNTLSAVSDLAAIDTPTGWPVTPGATLSFVNGTRTLMVTDGGSAYYYIHGVLYTLGGNHTVVLGTGVAGDEGLWYIYFDGSTLTASKTIWSFTAEDKALVAIVYWDATNNEAIILGYELHGFIMDGATHARLHYAGGTRWETGLLVSDAGGDTINVSAGDIWDEDINIPITDGSNVSLFEQILSPAQLPIYYRDGASNWRIYDVADKAAPTDVGYLGAGALKYNKLNGTWAVVTVGAPSYVAYYVVATNDQAEPIALIMGQRIDNTLAQAKDNNIFSGLSLSGLPFEEMVVLARLILRDGATYTLEDVLDLRVFNTTGNVTSPLITDHGGLGGLADDDHPQYALDTDVATYESALSDATSEVKASALANFKTNSNLISNISNTLSALSVGEIDAVSDMASANSNAISAVSNLAQSNATAVASIETLASDTLASLQVYESALSDATSEAKTSAHSELLSQIKIVSDATSVVKASAASELASAISNLQSSLSNTISEVKASAVSELASTAKVLSDATSDAYSMASNALSVATAGGVTESHMDSAIASVETALSDATSEAKTSAASELASTAKVLSDATSTVRAGVDSVETRMLSVTSDMTVSINTMVDSAISDVVATAVTETASLATAIASVESTLSSVIASVETALSDATSEVKTSAASELASTAKVLSDATSDAYSLATVAPVGASTHAVTLLQADNTAAKQVKIDAVDRFIPAGVTVTFQFEVTKTHSETAALEWIGFYGGGTILIWGNSAEGDAGTLHTTQDTIIDFTTNSVKGFIIENVACAVYVENLKILVVDTDVNQCIRFKNCNTGAYCRYNYLRANGITKAYGILFNLSSGNVEYTYVSNVEYGISARSCIVGLVDNDETGTDPAYGYYAWDGAIMGRRGTQPTGSVADELQVGGGRIFA